MTRWIIIDDATGKPEPNAFESDREAWQHQVELARAQNRSPYEWTSYPIEIPVR